jgi:hypothetical protein
VAVAIDDDIVLGVVLNNISARAALDRKPVSAMVMLALRFPPFWKCPAPLVFVAPAKMATPPVVADALMRRMWRIPYPRDGLLVTLAPL